MKTSGAFWIAVPVWLLALAGTAGAAQLRGAMLTPNWSVQGSTMYMTPGQQRGEIAAVARMGGNVVRLPVDWAELQPDGRIDAMYQAQLDQAVAAAGEYGQAVILNIIGTPCWASLQPSCPVTRKSHMDAPRPAAFAEVTRYLLTRYPMLYAYEVWNEPNCCPPEARSWNGSVADFAQVVIAAVEARNETRSHTRVIVGGFLMDSSRWLKALYREGMRVSDGISIHPYSLAGEGSAWVNPAKQGSPFLRSIKIARHIMLSHGDRSGIYLTEFGFASCPARPCVPAELAGRWLADSFRAAARFPWVKALTAFSMSDYSPPADPNPRWSLHSGILGRPAFGQVHRAIKHLRSKKYCLRTRARSGGRCRR